MLYIKFDNFDDIESLGDKKDYSMFVPIIDNNLKLPTPQMELVH